MSRGARTLLVLIGLAGCGFAGSGGGSSDGEPGADSRPGDPDARRVDSRPGEPDARPPDARVDAPMVTCSPGYTPLAGGSPANATYKGVSVRTPWDQARSQCQAEGADLVVVNDQNEANALASLVEDPGSPESPYFWIGMFDPPSGTDNDWVTVRGGAPPFVNWGSQQPSGGTQNCVLVDDGNAPNEFFDYDCDATQVYVCECLP